MIFHVHSFNSGPYIFRQFWKFVPDYDFAFLCILSTVAYSPNIYRLFWKFIPDYDFESQVLLCIISTMGHIYLGNSENSFQIMILHLNYYCAFFQQWPICCFWSPQRALDTLTQTRALIMQRMAIDERVNCEAFRFVETYLKNSKP
jgi:hypothetical protein